MQEKEMPGNVVNVEIKHPFGDIRPNRKSPGLAALLGLLIVGLGHMYLGMWGKGLGLLVIGVIISIVTFGFAAPIVWIVSCVWAYSDAKEMNRLNGYMN